MRPIFYVLLLLSAFQSSSQIIIRGPYLNLATKTGIVIRWKTDIATDSKVRFGTAAGNLSQSVIVSTVANEHIVHLTGLAANTKYFYSVGSSSKMLQGDTANYFKTAPSNTSTQKIRILAMGDMGNNSITQKSVRDAYLNYNGKNYTDIWMLLGDNAYEKGTEASYNTNFFGVYQQTLTKNHVLWPAPGNHDYANDTARQADHNIAYYKIFSLPTKGEAGGVASDNEAYYSYNYGNVHFVSLDSYGWETGKTRLYDTLGPQVTWLKKDLAANTQRWTVVYFHHPPFTKGGHDSDIETELIKIRQNLVRILERYKVDLVLSGHSHSYERSYLINGFYGTSGSFNASTDALSNSSGKYDSSDNSCVYIKNSTDNRNGVVYAIAGSAGKVSGFSWGTHRAMYYSNVTIGGALLLEIGNNRLDGRWICSDGVIRDHFTIMKDVNKKRVVTVESGAAATLQASWIGNYIWSTGETTRTININPSANATYTVRDNINCLADTFNVTVSHQISKIKLGPVADAYVRNGNYAGINYGGDTSLIVKSSTSAGYSRAGYLKFSLANIPKVKEAVLRVYGRNTDGSSAVSISTLAITNDAWTEKGINWNNAPPPLSAAVSSASVTNQLKYYEFDVTDFVKTQNAGDKIVSFLIKDITTQNKNIQFNTKENRNFRPELLITLDTTSQPSYAFADTLSPTADAFVRNGTYGTHNYGSDTSLIVKGSTSSGYTRASYLKFSLSNARNVAAAKLRIYGRNSENTSDINISVSGVDDTWTEGGISFNNAPANSPAVPAVFSINNVAKYYEVDVSSLVRTQFEGDKIVSFRLEDAHSQNLTAQFKSRENLRYPPQLIIYSDGTQPAGKNAPIIAGQRRLQNLEKPRVYPNPIKNSFTIQLPITYTDPFTLQVVEPSGLMHKVGNYQSNRTERNINIDIAKLVLKPGVYFIRIASLVKIEFMKIIVQ